MSPTLQIVADCIRNRRILGKRHGGEVSIGYDMALDSLAIDISNTTATHVEWVEFLKACELKVD